MFGISSSELVLILLIALLLFGGKKIPELARSVGKGISEFKKGVKEIENEVESADHPKTQLPPVQAANQQAFKFDPFTGKPIEVKFDPSTGKPVEDQTQNIR